MDINQAEKLLEGATTVRELFGPSWKSERIKADLIKACHPDRNPGDEKRATDLFNKVNDLWNKYKAKPIKIKSYTLYEIIDVGDVADIYFAEREEAGKVSGKTLKISRFKGGDKILRNESNILTCIRERMKISGYLKFSYQYYIPEIIESFAIKSDGIMKQVNVFPSDIGYYNLIQLHAKYPKLDGRHIGWIFKRLLTAIDICNQHNVVHGAILPQHVRILPGSQTSAGLAHALKLVGWGHSIDLNLTPRINVISSRYLDWYPVEVLSKNAVSSATDIFMAARCMVYLTGGDPISGDMPRSIPNMMQSFIKSCLIKGQMMRAYSITDLIDEFSAILSALYGPPKFHHLEMEK